jgi:hypothetical protein
LDQRNAFELCITISGDHGTFIYFLNKGGLINSEYTDGEEKGGIWVEEENCPS